MVKVGLKKEYKLDGKPFLLKQKSLSHKNGKENEKE